MKATFFSERQWFLLGAGGGEALSAGGGLLILPNLHHVGTVLSTCQLAGELGKPLFLAKRHAEFARWLM